MNESAVFSERASRFITYGIFFFYLLLILIMYGSFGGEFHSFMLSVKGDAAAYITMAEHPFTPVENPFGLRILTPLLVRGLRQVSGNTLPWDACWYVITLFALFGSIVFFYKFLRDHLKLDWGASTLAGLFLLSTFAYSAFQLQEPFRIDAVDNLFWMMALYYLFRDRYLVFNVILVVGFINKEVILFLAPLFPIFMLMRYGKISDRRVIRSILIMFFVIGLYLAFRLPLAHNLDGGKYTLMTTYDQTMWGTIMDALEHGKDVYALFFVFGFMWIVFFMALYEMFKRYGWKNRYLVASLYLCSVILFGRLFARDSNRVFSMLAPMVLSLSTVYLSTCFRGDVVRWGSAFLLAYMSISMGWVPERPFQIFLNLAVLFVVFQKSEKFDLGTNKELETELSRV